MKIFSFLSHIIFSFTTVFPEPTKSLDTLYSSSGYNIKIKALLPNLSAFFFQFISNLIYHFLVCKLWKELKAVSLFVGCRLVSVHELVLSDSTNSSRWRKHLNNYYSNLACELSQPVTLNIFIYPILIP